jgi:hypothetical protein
VIFVVDSSDSRQSKIDGAEDHEPILKWCGWDREVGGRSDDGVSSFIVVFIRF